MKMVKHLARLLFVVQRLVLLPILHQKKHDKLDMILLKDLFLEWKKNFLLFNKQHAGIVDIPVQEIIESFRRQIEVQRACIKEGKRTAEDVLNSYIQEYQGKFVVVKYGEKASPAAMFGDGSSVGRTTTRAEVMGRVEHGVSPGYVDFYIEERLLRAFCSNMSFSYAMFTNEIRTTFTVHHVHRKDMLAKTEGPPMRVNALKLTANADTLDDALLQPVSLVTA